MTAKTTAAALTAGLILGATATAAAKPGDKPDDPTITCRVMNKQHHLCTLHDEGNPVVVRVRYKLNGEWHWTFQYESTIPGQGVAEKNAAATVEQAKS